MDHYALLFVSDLAPNAPSDTISGIARQARSNNERTDITGLLVFDGKHFVQVMEGPQQAVVSTADLMKTDRRHERMEVLHSAAQTRPRRFPHWRLGYLVLDLQEFGLEGLRGKRGREALDAFNFMLPALDMAVGEALPAKLLRPKRS